MRETLIKHNAVNELAMDAQSHPALSFSMFFLEILFFAVGAALCVVGHEHGLGKMYGEKITASGERLFLELVAATIAAAVAPFALAIYLTTTKNATEICYGCIVIIVNGGFLLAGGCAFFSIILSGVH